MALESDVVATQATEDEGLVSATGQRLASKAVDKDGMEGLGGGEAGGEAAALPREAVNAKIHDMYVRQDYDKCLEAIDAAIEAS